MILAVALTGCSRSPAASAEAPRGGAPAALAVVLPKTACSALADFDLTAIGGAGSRITAAVDTTNRAGAAVCAVEGTLAPAIGFAVQLPIASWTQRYLQIGCGGLCGSLGGNVGAAEGCAPLQSSGFALAATDMGHQDQDGRFGQDPVKRADFAHRAQHLTAQAAKALIAAFYGQPQRYAYFSGCSDGGREALIEAQRYPEDFDGIIAGAGALNFLAQNAIFHAWQARANTGADSKPILLAGRLPLLHRAVLAACDGLDGQADGLIANPLACHFDPATLQCPADATATTACFTPAEVGVVRAFYEGPHDAKSGRALTVGGPQPGSELAWAGVYVPAQATDSIFSAQVSLPVLRYLAFEQASPADFRLADLTFDLATFDRLRSRHRLLDATNPDLAAFAGRGGKLIIWHGWSDPHISPLNSIAYYSAVRQFLGAARTDAFARLYLFPGMYHCANGEGPALVDLLTPMLAWVEGGVAPAAIEARQSAQGDASDFGAPRGAGGLAQRPAPLPGAQAAALGPTAAAALPPVRSRPVYPWPRLARWDGQGDPLRAASYGPGPSLHFQPRDWAGGDFFTPYAPLAQ
ncbi:tannase/feruloyl esterase family alpha/beta hydrolase (plasmid) [Pseudomonas oryzihabitans]|nr:tannase/feruloyl esterase family alpha/beta hydrolase [Pseudomonas oryzihabitans]